MSSELSLPLSPPRASPSRPLSRPSSSNSLRSAPTHSPAAPSLDASDPVAIRNHMSTLKHSIRHHQAQLHTLENIILAGPRPIPPGIMGSDSPEHEIPNAHNSYGNASHASTSSTTGRMKRLSSYEVLQGISGPESNLPLPKRESQAGLKQDGIREGIPMDFGVGSVNPNAHKRVSSPTRTLSRIPVASVGNARALADEGQPGTSRQSAPGPIDLPSPGFGVSPSSLQPPSPNLNSKRASLTPAGTSKVLADLQTGVVNARNALENTKAQLRLSQRSVAQLTRQTEDLKEGRERLRLENEGLNNVVARKERLLQEVLDRARKAETDTVTLKSQLKNEQTSSKKTLREMEAALTESTALSQKSEREYITLRDSLKGMTESWKTETENLRDEMRNREDKIRKEAEEVGTKYKKLLEDVQAVNADRKSVALMRAEDANLGKELEDGFREQIAMLKGEVERSSKESDEAVQTSKELALELSRLRRLMRSAGSSASR